MALQCHMALTMPRVTHRDLTRDIFNFFLKNLKIKKKLKFKKKIKKTTD